MNPNRFLINQQPNYFQKTTETMIHPNLKVTNSYSSYYLPPTQLFEYTMKRSDASNHYQDSYSVHQDITLQSQSSCNILITKTSGPADDKLTVVLIGNDDVPDVKMYSSVIKTVEFVGHISFTIPMFGIIAQLPLVEKVIVHLGKSQLPIFREFDFLDIAKARFDNTPLCSQVLEFEVIIDLDCYFYPSKDCKAECSMKCWDLLKSTFDSLVECIFKRAEHSFTNLTKLTTVSPETDIYFGSIHQLFQKLYPKLSLANSMNVMGCPSLDKYNNFNNAGSQLQQEIAK